MVRRVKSYLLNMKTTDDEVKLNEMSTQCEPPGNPLHWSSVLSTVLEIYLCQYMFSQNGQVSVTAVRVNGLIYFNNL